jgi:hypothetical protein
MYEHSTYLCLAFSAPAVLATMLLSTIPVSILATHFAMNVHVLLVQLLLFPFFHYLGFAVGTRCYCMPVCMKCTIVSLRYNSSPLVVLEKPSVPFEDSRHPSLSDLSLVPQS